MSLPSHTLANSKCQHFSHREEGTCDCHETLRGKIKDYWVEAVRQILGQYKEELPLTIPGKRGASPSVHIVGMV